MKANAGSILTRWLPVSALVAALATLGWVLLMSWSSMTAPGSFVTLGDVFGAMLLSEMALLFTLPCFLIFGCASFVSMLVAAWIARRSSPARAMALLPAAFLILTLLACIGYFLAQGMVFVMHESRKAGLAESLALIFDGSAPVLAIFWPDGLFFACIVLASMLFAWRASKPSAKALA